MASRKIRMRKWRASGHGHKHNKKSVAYRKQLKRLKARRLKRKKLYAKLNKKYEDFNVAGELLDV